MYDQLRQPVAGAEGIDTAELREIGADEQRTDVRLRRDADLYLAAALRSYERADEMLAGGFNPAGSPYRRLYGGRLTLNCPSDGSVREVKANFGVALGPDGRLYLNTGDSGCYRPIASSDVSSLDKDGSVDSDSVDQVAQEVVGLLGGIAGKVEVGSQSQFLTMNRKAVRRLANGIRNGNRRD